MANYIKVATLGFSEPTIYENNLKKTNELMKKYIQQKIFKVLPFKPDLIVLPEACDRPNNLRGEKLREYYYLRKDETEKMVSKIAQTNKCYIVYSGIRVLPDNSLRNSSIVFNKKGEIAGIYDKVHPPIEEIEEGILPGNDFSLIETEFGKIGCVICFDLNFDDIREEYRKQAPCLIVFSSMYHGGDIVQGWWAYTCRCYFIGAVSGLPSQIRNPFGEVIASSTNYFDYAVATINLDYSLVHLDYNREKLEKLKAKYQEKVEIYDPGYIASVMVSSKIEGTSTQELLAEFNILSLDEYLYKSEEIQKNKRQVVKKIKY